MNKKTKTQEESKLREPKAKTSRFGLKVPTIRMPHEDLIRPEQSKSEVIPLTKESLPRQTSLSSLSRQTKTDEIAPTRNFQKVPNSITKAAIPEGLFKQGKSKHLYDVLYSLTRGAVEPKRTIRISKTKLRKLAAIGSRVTFDSCVSHLETVGLLKLTVRIGEHEGNEFEVFLPEEMTLPSMPSQTSVTSLTKTVQKLDTLVCLETSQTRQSSTPINTGVTSTPNTSFKTNKNDDDDAFADFANEFENFSRKVTGQGIRRSEKAKWRELAQVIILELEIAAARTNVSSLPAFGAEHLRRRLFGKARSEKKSQNNSSRVGETPPQIRESFDEKGNLIVKPLTEEGKAENLKILREMIAERFSTSGMEKFFTPEDWAELSETLNKS